MSFWTPENLREAMKGHWIVRPNGSHPQTLRAVTTDSRQAGPGIAFFARRGRQDDGHRFLTQAAQAGSPLLVADDESQVPQTFPGAPPPAVVKVDNTTLALGRLAAAYRQTLKARVIAVTGSVGKTTTKLLIDSVLSVRYRGTISPKSFNNEVGVPLTILSADPADDYLVVEIGANAPGEIANLARITEPDVALITYIGSSHLEGLGGLDGVLREKASLLSHLRPSGLAILNGDFPGLIEYRRLVTNAITFGCTEGCDLRMTAVRSDASGVTFQVNDRFEYRLPLLGQHNALNGLAAIAVGRYMKLTEEQIADGLAAAKASDMRLQVERYGPRDEPVTVLNDCYNANPDSVAAALRVLRQYPAAARRVAVLGDMGELGPSGPDLHRRIGHDIIECNLDLVVLIGRLMLFTAETLSRVPSAPEVQVLGEWAHDTPDRLAALVQPGDTVLIKASRAMGFERLVQGIAKRFGADAPPTAPHTPPRATSTR